MSKYPILSDEVNDAIFNGIIHDVRNDPDPPHICPTHQIKEASFHDDDIRDGEQIQSLLYGKERGLQHCKACGCDIYCTGKMWMRDFISEDGLCLECFDAGEFCDYDDGSF